MEQATRLHVLLVEDTPEDALLVREALPHADADFEVRHVTTIAAALEELAERQHEVVLLDLALPDSQGVDTVRRLHAHSPHTPIVVFTASDDDALALKCIESGADDFITKGSVDVMSLRRTIGYARSRLREQHIAALEQTIERYQELSSAGTTTHVTRELAGSAHIRTRFETEFRGMVAEYRPLLERYLQQLIVKAPKPRQGMEALVTRIGHLGGGPRDLIDLHVAGMEEAVRGASARRASSYSIDGRLFALEMMGILVDYYRVGIRRHTDEGLQE